MRDRHREAWTALVEGREAKKAAKYGNERKGRYSSKHEAAVASSLHALAAAGHIANLREQVPITIAAGRDGVSSVRYIADFVYEEDGATVVADAKGCRTDVYRIKKRLLFLLCGIEIREF